MLWQEAIQDKNNAYADTYDVIVIGAGHAGCEAGVAAARLGCKTLLLSITLDAVANLPCNPSIGGTAKGQLVREIDALGGVMGRIADQTAIQYRMLNQSKGPAVQSPRAQVDRRRYQEAMKEYLEQLPNLDLCQGEVTDLLWDPSDTAGLENRREGISAVISQNFSQEGAGLRIAGVLTRNGSCYRGAAVILATGTFLGGEVFIGTHHYPSGPDHLQPAQRLSRSLRESGFLLRRFKTGTPVRVNAHSLNTEKLEEQVEDAEPWRFSFCYELKPEENKLPSRPCWLTWTTDETARIIRENLDRSPLYSGEIEGVGPRYCPSIEDKIVRFPDKLRHQIFVEPMGLHTAELYLQGLSTSLPEDVQRALVHSLPGLESAKIQRSAYAIEYDCIDPQTLEPTLEFRAFPGLYGAGQINGTSGYEEAAAQGLLAGINAARKLKGKEGVVLGRDQAYIGVLIDDLVNKGTAEPYRMMTSRAEYRLLLRQDNADTRLIPIGRVIGLVDEVRYQEWETKQKTILAEKSRLEKTRIQPSHELNTALAECNSPPVTQGITLAQLLLRPHVTADLVDRFDPSPSELPLAWKREVEIEIRYAGYIALEQKRIERFRKLEDRSLPVTLDYKNLRGLRLEAQQKLQQIRPRNVGQAARISGVSPADISVLLVYLASLNRRTKPLSQTGDSNETAHD